MQIARGQCQIANCKCQGPRANSQVPIAMCDCQVPRANCKFQGVRGQEFHTRGANINQKHTHFRKTKASIIRVSSSNHEMPWFWCKFPLANARGPRARGQLQITNCEVPGAKGQRHIARGQGQGISEKIHKNRVKPDQIQSKTRDLDSQGFGFQS